MLKASIRALGNNGGIWAEVGGKAALRGSQKATQRVTCCQPEGGDPGNSGCLEAYQGKW